MRISPTYAHRNDLSSYWKWHFSLQESIRRNKFAQYCWQAYCSVRWLDDMVAVLSIVLALVPFIVLDKLETLCLLFSEDGDEYVGWVYLGFVVICSFITPWTLVPLVGFLAPFAVWALAHSTMDPG